MKGKDPAETDIPISLKLKLKQLKLLHNKTKTRYSEVNLFNERTKYQREKNKERFEILIYPKQFKHVKKIISNLAVEEIVARYHKKAKGKHKFVATIHLHT